MSVTEPLTIETVPAKFVTSVSPVIETVSEFITVIFLDPVIDA